MSRRFFQISIRVLVTTILGGPAIAIAQDFAKLASNDPVVHLVNGSGSERIVFSKKHDQNIPVRVVVTDATGHGNTIPAVNIQASSPTEVATDVFTVTITVSTQAYVEPAVPYESTLLLYGQQTAPPVPVKFRIEDDSVVGFDVSPATIATALTDDASARQRLQVTNTGKASIGEFEVTSSTLVDPVNAHRTQMPLQIFKKALPPGHSTDLDFEVPRPSKAGTYTGTIYVLANSGVPKPIALTLQTRGPYNQCHLPVLLLLAVVLTGFGISSLLDNWFGGGGLARAQAYLSIKTSEKQLKQVTDEIEQWKLTLPTPPPLIELSQTEISIAQELQDISDDWSNFQSATDVQLVANATRYSVAASAALYLWGSVKLATSQWSASPPTLKRAIDGLDGVPVPTSSADLDRYRNALGVVLKSAAIAPAGAAVTQGAAVSAPGPGHWNGQFVRLRISAMKVFYQVVVGTIVLITAYLSFYANHLAFGTITDYVTVFLWSLGLTTTGTQIIARVHRP